LTRPGYSQSPWGTPAPSRQGHGYGKSQKVPSFGTGSGSETAMGSSETGIYVEPDESGLGCLDYDEDFGFDDPEEIDAFVNKINGLTIVADPTFWPRADRSSLGSSSNRWDLGLGESSLPTARKGMVPFANKTLYPGGFSGPPLGTGTANQAFRTTGPYKRTGTQYGSSRAPLPSKYDDDFEEAMSFLDILNLSPSERSMMRQKIKIMKVLNRLDEIDKEYEV
jgi:hypothetical protein